MWFNRLIYYILSDSTSTFVNFKVEPETININQVRRGVKTDIF